jgi:hypothetical protein
MICFELIFFVDIDGIVDHHFWYFLFIIEFEYSHVHLQSECDTLKATQFTVLTRPRAWTHDLIHASR